MKTIQWIFAVVVLLYLWQVKNLQPVIKAVAVIVVLGILLRYWGNISGQFKQIVERSK